MKTKFTALILTVAMMFGVLTTTSFALTPEYGEEYENQPNIKYSQSFSDVDKDYWAFEYIEEMVSRGVLSGYPNGKFYPNDYVTRAQFAKIMTIAAGLKVPTNLTTTSYNDVSLDDWYAPYIETARFYLSGYRSGNSLLYLPNDNALREDIAVALVKLKGYDTTVYDASMVKTMFVDYQSISDGAKKYVALAVENGLISGYEDDTFRGQNGITRAEAATLLWRAYQYGSGNKVFEPEIIDASANTTKNNNDTKTNENKNNKPNRNDEDEEKVTEKPSKDNNKDNSKKEEIKDTEEEKKNDDPEYLYEVTTVLNGVNDMDMMINDDEGNIYYVVGTNLNKNISEDDAKIYKVTGKGKATEIYSSRDIPILSDSSEMTKSEKANIKTKFITFGYNQNDDSIYALIKQQGTYYLYNINDKTSYEPIDPDKLSLEISGDRSIENNLIFDNNNNIFYRDYHIINKKIINYDCGNLGKRLYSDNIYIIKDRNIKIIDSKSGELSNLDYYIPNIDVVFGINNKFAYALDKNEAIHQIDIKTGDSKEKMTIDDIDICDGKVFKISNINCYYYIAIDNDGSIYFWDSNYACIRKISEK